MLVGQSAQLGMGNSPGQCRNCKKAECLKNAKGYYHRIGNAPTDHVFRGRLFYITRETVWFLLEELQHRFPDRPAFETLQIFADVCPWSISDPKARTILERYYYCKEMNTPPFPTLDETPEWWLQSVAVITNEQALCYKHWTSSNATKNIPSNGQPRGDKPARQRAPGR